MVQNQQTYNDEGSLLIQALGLLRPHMNGTGNDTIADIDSYLSSNGGISELPAPSHAILTDMTPRGMAAHGHLVADILKKWGADATLQAAGLLHSVLWNCVVSVEEAEAACGARIVWLCQEYQRILQHTPETHWRGKPLVLERIKHFMLAYRDADLAFLGAAHLWSNFLMAQNSAPKQHHLYADEGRQVLRPFLDMLGMRELREELDGWLGQVGKKKSRKAADTKTDDASQKALRELQEQLASHLSFSHAIYEPQTLSSTNDSSATFKAQQTLNVNILVNEEVDCYRTLHVLHRLYIPIEGGLADYIGASRMNGYRCLQVPVSARLGSNKIRVNFQICTREMDEINRWGLAALHMRQRLNVEVPTAWWNNSAEQYEKIESAPLGTLPEMLHVFSPHGQIFHFYRGSTVVDFAYHVHSELAAQSRRFYVNGETVEPATVLHHLDLVELEQDPHAPGPTKVWLNAAHTSRARTHIDRFLKRQGQGVYHGQKTIDRRLKALEDHYGFNIAEYRINQALTQEMRRRSLSRREDLMDEIAAGRLVADRILHPLFADEIIRQVRIPQGMRLRPHQLNLAQCCRPRLSDDIIGRPYERDGEVTKLKIHRKDCQKLQDRDGYLDLKWRLQPDLKTVAQLELKALDEDGLLGDAVSQVYAMLPRVTLHKSEAAARHGHARIRFTLEAESREVLDEIVDALRRLPGRTVDEVRLMNLPLSEREDLVTPVKTSGFNPYSRLPVHEQGMFFGRTEELDCLDNWLRSDVGIIWLRGQKRVGKTSLMLHLKDHYLDHQELVPIFVDFQLLGSLNEANLFFELANTVYAELQTDSRIGELGAPLRELFEHDPPGQLVTYLRSIQSHPGVGRLVLLLDEFSRTTDAYQAGRIEEGFFQRWRGLLQATVPDISYIVVIQQQTYDSLFERVQGGDEDPSWHLLELGETIPLKPLVDKDARHLIEWPIRNYMDFSAEAVDYIYTLTGGSPFLIQAFCFKLVAHMTRLNKRQVEQNDIDVISMEFMSPNESLFAHLLDLIRGVANSVCLYIAQIAEEQNIDAVTWEQIQNAVPNIPSDRLRRTLQELCERDILIQSAPNSWQFANLLFRQWLSLNSLPG